MFEQTVKKSLLILSVILCLAAVGYRMNRELTRGSNNPYEGFVID